jgi:hypothetical protein
VGSGKTQDIDDESTIKLALLHKDPVDFIRSIDVKYANIPLAEKGQFYENVGDILYGSSLLSPD